MGRKEKQDLQTRKAHISGCPGGRQRKVVKGENLQHLNVDLCPYVVITTYLTLQIRSTHHAPRPWQFQSKQNKDKNPSSLCEGGDGMKIRDYDPPQTHPPQWIFHPFSCTPHITSLPKKLRAAIHLKLPTLISRVYYQLNPYFTYLPDLPVSFLIFFWDKSFSLETESPGKLKRVIMPGFHPWFDWLVVWPGHWDFSVPLSDCKVQPRWRTSLSRLSHLLLQF